MPRKARGNRPMVEAKGELEPRTVGSLMRDPANAPLMRKFLRYNFALFAAPTAAFYISGYYVESVETQALFAMAAVLLILVNFVVDTIREEAEVARDSPKRD